MIDLARFLKLSKSFVKSNSPAILTGLAVAGVVGTTVLSVKARDQANQELQDQFGDHYRDTEWQEKVRTTWRFYIPTAISGATTIVCILSAHSINTRRNAALVSAVTIGENAFREYKEKVVETIGKNKEQTVRDEIAQDRVNRNDSGQNIIITGNEVLFLDAYTDRYFKSTMEQVRKAQNDVNEIVINDMYASLNDYYRKLGLRTTSQGEEVGWTNEVMLDAYYTTALSEDNQPCIVINFHRNPIPHYHKIW